MRPFLLFIAAGGLAACAQEPPATSGTVMAAPAGGCLASGEGRFEASIRGDLQADIAWSDAQMECDGGLRPDGQGLRVTVAGPLAAQEAAGVRGGAAAQGTRRLRFIIGVDLRDAASGPAQVLPTNLTLIVEDENQLFATLGDDKCAVEDLRRERLASGLEKVSGRGYCLGQAADLSGERHVLVDTFSFTSLVRIDADIVAPDA